MVSACLRHQRPDPHCRHLYPRLVSHSQTRPSLFPIWRLTAFLLGLTTIWLSIASPLDGFADVLLSAHMVEHLLLMSFVPPLLLIGYPVVPLLRGLPHTVTVHLLGPFIRSKSLRQLGHLLTTPLAAWLIMNVVFLGWHIPAAYDFALEHEHWHEFEHACFLGASLLFWFPLIRPWPATSPLRRLAFNHLPGFRRHRQHDALGFSCLLRPPRLSLLPASAQSLPHRTAQRSSHRSSHHVDRRLTRLPSSRLIHHSQVASTGFGS